MTTSGLRGLGIFIAVVLVGSTALGALAAARNWGAEEPGEQRVSLREGSVGRPGGFFMWYGSRTHFGGGLGGGK